jgi:CRP/FNR family cyclic AMP-dependent transcriptional regulator
VGKDGVSLDLPLTHQILGQLVGAQRPTVTLAIQALSEEGQLLRKAEGGFLLPWSSRTHLEKAVGWTQWAS